MEKFQENTVLKQISLSMVDLFQQSKPFYTGKKTAIYQPCVNYKLSLKFGVIQGHERSI